MNEPVTVTPDQIARTQLTVGVVAVIVGVLGFWVSRDAAFVGGNGATIFDELELRTMSYNGLGALCTVVFGALGIIAGALRRPAIGLIGGLGFALVTIQPLIQWRTGTENLLAANGRNFGFALALALGLVVPAIVARMSPSGTGTSGSSPTATGAGR